MTLYPYEIGSGIVEFVLLVNVAQGCIDALVPRMGLYLMEGCACFQRKRTPCMPECMDGNFGRQSGPLCCPLNDVGYLPRTQAGAQRPAYH